MQLILQDAAKAQVYGLPAADTTVEAVRAQLVAQGFSTDAADAHLNFALSAGVYRTASMSAGKAGKADKGEIQTDAPQGQGA